MTQYVRKTYIQVLVVVLFAASLKYYYSSAGAEDLLWLLGPTAAAVGSVTGTNFEFEAHAGYLNAEKNFLIAPVCSGMNFLVTAFLLLSIQSLWRNRSKGTSWRFLLTSAAAAYAATIAANTVRISSAIFSQGGKSGAGWFDRDQIHRIEGITVYFGFLLLLFFAGELISGKRKAGVKSAGSQVRALLIPLSVYYAMTLGVPLLNGAYRRGGEFAEHALFVLVIPLLILVPIAAFRWIGRFCSSSDSAGPGRNYVSEGARLDARIGF